MNLSELLHRHVPVRSLRSEGEEPACGTQHKVSQWKAFDIFFCCPKSDSFKLLKLLFQSLFLVETLGKMEFPIFINKFLKQLELKFIKLKLTCLMYK